MEKGNGFLSLGKGFFGCFLNPWSEGTLIFQTLVQWALNFNQFMNFYPNQLLKDMNYNLPIYQGGGAGKICCILLGVGGGSLNSKPRKA